MIDVVVDGVLRGGIYALAALSYVIIYRASKIVNLAYGAMAMLAAYLYWFFSPMVGPVLAVLISVGTLVMVAFLVERGVIRPMIGEPIIQIIMATIGVAFLIRGALLAFLILGPRLPGFQYQPFEVHPLPTGIYRLGDLAINANFLWAFIASLASFGAFLVFYRYSLLGIAMRAMANDRQAALALGVKPVESYMFSWAIAGALITLSGLFYASIFGGVAARVEEIGIKALPVIILGGLDSVGGAIVAGIIVGLSESFGRLYLDDVFGGGFGDVFPLILMVLIMLFRPYGLFGTERIERV